MARHTDAVCKLCRTEGQKLFLKGERCMTPKCAVERRSYPPGMHGRKGGFKRKVSDYSRQLREKQKARRIYGIMERQFRRYFAVASRSKGLTGAALLVLLELRLDNVVYRLGFADSRAQARQLVRHGHFAVNGRKVNIPSYQVKQGDVIAVRDGSRDSIYFKDLQDRLGDRIVPQWMSLDMAGFAGRVLEQPSRQDIDAPLNEQLIVEFYSR